jgi:hypothetical protein
VVPTSWQGWWALKLGICVGWSSLEDFLEEGEGPVKIKKLLKEEVWWSRDPYLELLPSQGLLVSWLL